MKKFEEKLKPVETLKGVYFYNGFSKPEKLANTIDELLNGLKSNVITIDDNYTGNANEDIIEGIEDGIAQEYDMNEMLNYYDIYINVNKQVLRDLNVNTYGLDANTYLD